MNKKRFREKTLPATIMVDPVGSSSTHLYTGHEFLQY